MNDQDYNPYLPDGPGSRLEAHADGPGLADFLPTYAGNLDIKTAAGLRTAEMLDEAVQTGKFAPPESAWEDPAYGSCRKESHTP